MNRALKNLLGGVPGVARLYSAARPGRPRTRYNLEQLAANLPAALDQARPYSGRTPSKARLLIFATLHYWIEQATIVGLTLRALGHDVTLSYLPYSRWDTDINAFDLARQDHYTRAVLSPLRGLLGVTSLLKSDSGTTLPTHLQECVRLQSEYDTMYSLQNEEVDPESVLYRLRHRRNSAAARSALSLLQEAAPDCVLIPNGLVTELGVFYQVARSLGIPAVTYEFNDQREQIWIARNDIVMHQNTDAMWHSRCGRSLTDSERRRLDDFEKARSAGSVYGKGTRRWQDIAASGGEGIRQALELDERPVVLLPTNVLGDSLTLGRHVFASTMAEWLEATVRFFLTRSDVQLVIRVHPGERLIKGASMLDVVRHVLPEGSRSIHVVAPMDKINTYDIMELASLGLTYTTTVGLEMAMRGIPVIVAGKTHYRNRGFTQDPNSWEQYFGMLNQALGDLSAGRLGPETVEAARNYAYRFFFEYPFDFPWRLMYFWTDMETWPLKRVLSDEGQAAFGRTFRHLAGEQVSW